MSAIGDDHRCPGIGNWGHHGGMRMRYALDMAMPEEFLDMNDSEMVLTGAGPVGDDLVAAAFITIAVRRI